MSKIIKSDIKVTGTITIELNEEEARALNAMSLYGTNAFINAFEENLGKFYFEPYRNGIATLFETANGEVKAYLDQIDKCKKVIK